MHQIFTDYASLCAKVSDEICEAISQKPDLLLCIAAGHTSLGVFKALRDARAAGRVDFSKAAFVAMDEWLGMSKTTKNSCGMFLCDEFLDHMNFADVRLFDGTVTDTASECAAVEEFIKTHGGAIDYLVLGTGMNGHLALNEPGTATDSRAHVTALDPVTTEVGQKYFNEQTALTGGITLGLADFYEARRSVLMVCGEHKRGILEKILYGPISTDIPATAVRNYKNASIYADQAASEGVIK